MGSINFTAVEGGDNSSYAGSEAREVFINTSSDISARGVTSKLVTTS